LRLPLIHADFSGQSTKKLEEFFYSPAIRQQAAAWPDNLLLAVVFEGVCGRILAQRVGQHVTVVHIAFGILTSAPPMPPAWSDEVTPLNHGKFAFAKTFGFSARIHRTIIAF